MAFNATFHQGQLTDAQARLVKASLHSADPPTTGNEITSAGQRATLTWSAPSGTPASMSDTVSMPVDGGETVAAVGFWDGAGSPVFQGGGPVDTPEAFSNPGTAEVTITVEET